VIELDASYPPDLIGSSWLGYTYATTLREVLRAASTNNLPGGWVYLPRPDELLLDTPCLLLSNDPDAEMDERGIPLTAVNQGFPLPWRPCRPSKRR
jgi:hypothetical protein